MCCAIASRAPELRRRQSICRRRHPPSYRRGCRVPQPWAACAKSAAQKLSPTSTTGLETHANAIVLGALSHVNIDVVVIRRRAPDQRRAPRGPRFIGPYPLSKVAELFTPSDLRTAGGAPTAGACCKSGGALTRQSPSSYGGAKLIPDSASPATFKEGRSVGWSESYFAPPAAQSGSVGRVGRLAH